MSTNVSQLGIKSRAKSQQKGYKSVISRPKFLIDQEQILQEKSMNSGSEHSLSDSDGENIVSAR